MNWWQSTWKMWVDGGVMMVPLALIALFIYGLGFRLLVYLAGLGHGRLRAADIDRLVAGPDDASGQVAEVLRYTQDEVRSLEEIQNRFAEVMASKVPEIDRRLVFLNVMISAAPLVGLLGTVLGILKTFQAIAVGGGKTVDMIASGISEALITTEVGLLVALPGMVLAFAVRRKRNEYVGFLAHLESVTLQHFKPIFHGATRIIRRPAKRPGAAPSPAPRMEQQPVGA